MASVLTLNPHRAGWLRSPAFDLTYVVGIGSVAILSGWFVVANPKLFPVIFVLDAWLLGYHHVISTFTRLTFDTESFREHRFLVTWLPLIVLTGVAAACVLFGGWILTTIYLYWQSWHYTRQSYGISRIYQRKACVPDDLVYKLVIYALPAWGILHRSYQAPEKFLFMEVKVIPIPLWLVVAAGAATFIILSWWVAQTVKAWLEGSFSISHTLYLCSHLLVFGVGYLLIEDINHGWLVLNIWHNCQYILTVWMFNNNRFKGGLDYKHRFLSYLSQRSNLLMYFAVCLILSTGLYAGLQYSLGWLALATATSLPVMAIAMQAINFHHYLVDALIWKVRRKPVRQNFGIA
ncbi:MAG TPA: hypothetical protein VFH31_18090 [Pyrinomonadaceae bacterium]|nr:hypothetical protein [Pyrinomonadaceae bacterium]